MINLCNVVLAHMVKLTYPFGGKPTKAPDGQTNNHPMTNEQLTAEELKYSHHMAQQR
jgi:hypothetical protein